MLLQVALCLLLRRQGQVREEATQDVQVQKPLGGPQQGVGDEGAQPGAGRAGRRSVQASRHNEAAGALKEHAACVGAHLHVCVCVSESFRVLGKPWFQVSHRNAVFGILRSTFFTLTGPARREAAGIGNCRHFFSTSNTEASAVFFAHMYHAVPALSFILSKMPHLHVQLRARL